VRDVRPIYRPRTFALAFGAYFAGIGVAAWSFASDLPGPWYGPEMSRWIYATYFVGSAVFLVGLAHVGYAVQAAFDRHARDVRERLQGLRTEASVVPPDLRFAAPARAAAADEFDLSMSALVRLESEIGADAEAEMGETMVLLRSQKAGTVAVGAHEARLLRRREALRLRQDFVARFLAGPAVASGIVLSLSGALLPGTGGFLQTFHQANTAIALAIAYSWPGIGAYLVASILALVGSLRAERKRTSAGDGRPVTGGREP
jgi:hypothetical protein